MDRNSATGMILIALILVSYFYFFAPKPIPQEQEAPMESVKDSVTQSKVLPDSVTAQPISEETLTFSEQEIELIDVQNEDLRLQITSNGSIKEIELLQFKTYSQEPLMLAAGFNNRFKMRVNFQGQALDLYRLHFNHEKKVVSDTTIIVLKAQLSESAWVSHTYFIPSKGYEIGYKFRSEGLTITDPLTYEWEAYVPFQEKDLTDSKRRTTVNYYTLEDGFDDLSETGDDEEMFAGKVKWVSFKQKFFISAIIAHQTFSGGEVSIADNTDENVVKLTKLKLFIPPSDVQNASFKYYFGPNDYNILPDVAPDFSRNLYIGWPPILWVNKYIIIPIFNFLEQFIGSYGIIIMLLVFIVKLALTPLSYKSYLGMAKMKLLKPELEVIKEKNGDNMTQTQQDQMKLYQQAGVNPFSGCIPMVLQMPILFAMFYFFPVSIQLRQQPFLWAEDLSTYDSVLDLPFTIPFYGAHVSLFVLLMTASTLIYTWQNNQINAAQGPMKSFSYVMPIIFMFVLNSFSSGLSFYYFISNIVTFGQQAIIRRFVDEDKVLAIMEKNKQNAVQGKGKKSRFMAKLEDAMKASEEARKKGKK